MSLGSKSHQDAIRRFKGYLFALEEAGVLYDDELVFERGLDGISGEEAIEELMAN